VFTKKELEVLALRSDGLTQAAVAKRLGISQAAVSTFERTARAKFSDANETLRVAKLLGMKAEQDEIARLLSRRGGAS